MNRAPISPGSLVWRSGVAVAHVASRHRDGDGVQRSVCGLRLEPSWTGARWVKISGATIRTCASCERMRGSATS